MEDKILGMYRIRYKQETIMAPVTEGGILILPDGKRIQLSDERFKQVREQLEAWSREQQTSWSLIDTRATKNDEVASAETEKEGQEAPLPETTDKATSVVEEESVLQEKKRPEKKKKEKPVKPKVEKVREPITPITVVVIALASVLLTLLIITAMFLYFTGSGRIVVNPKWNGLVIYEEQKGKTTDSSMASEMASYFSWENDVEYNVPAEIVSV